MSCVLNEKLFNRGETVAVALSGGKDSMCLFRLLLDNRRRLGITVKAVNVEHGIRGESSVKDSEFVADYCRKNSIELKSYKLDCKTFSEEQGYSEEEGARIARYSCFNDALNSGFCDKIATAHHLSDSFETTLFNLFRGASAAGVAGISETRDNGRIIRPLAKISKRDIDEYIEKNNVPFVQDETNFENAYSRNYIRNKIIPVILERFPEAEKSVGRFCEVTEKENDYLNSEAQKALTTDESGAYFIKTDIPDCIFSRAAIIALKVFGIGKDYEKVHIDEISALKNVVTSTCADLPKGVKAVKEYDSVVLYRPTEFCFEEPFSYSIFDGCLKKICFRHCEKSGINKKSLNKSDINRTLYFDADKIPGNAVVRTAKSGDTFTKFGGGTKKLNDYFTDVKIPLRLRDKVLLVCDGSNVLIVCGVEISDNVRISSDTTLYGECVSEQK